jgi:DMSO/TMAO reductase YedYZ heme-binding membrane subunit
MWRTGEVVTDRKTRSIQRQLCVSATMYTSDHTLTNIERKLRLLDTKSADNGPTSDLSPNHRILRFKNVKINKLKSVIYKILFLILSSASLKDPTQRV